ncbi:MAG: group 1 truncated hemoglobin [Proteobacteria bacterium]|nr:MAG: group 1 truncated hemoglobin [Pseudomonadota bacterium]
MTRTPTLYDRLGGEAGIAALIDAFYGRVLGDPELAPFFEHASLERLRRMQSAFFGAALDGPVAYDGRSLAAVHYGRGIGLRHFALFVRHLLQTLQAQGLAEEDVLEVIARIDTYADEITGDTGLGA